MGVAEFFFFFFPLIFFLNFFLLLIFQSDTAVEYPPQKALVLLLSIRQFELVQLFPLGLVDPSLMDMTSLYRIVDCSLHLVLGFFQLILIERYFRSPTPQPNKKEEDRNNFTLIGCHRFISQKQTVIKHFLDLTKKKKNRRKRGKDPVSFTT